MAKDCWSMGKQVFVRRRAVTSLKILQGRVRLVTDSFDLLCYFMKQNII